VDLALDLDALIDCAPEFRSRIRDAMLRGGSDGGAGGVANQADQALAEALRRLSRWRRALDEAGERIQAARAEVAGLAKLVGAAGHQALGPDPFSDSAEGEAVAEAMEIAWLAGGSVGDRPQQVADGMRDGLREAARRLEQSVQAVQRFRHGADAAMVLSRPASSEPAVRDATRMLTASRCALRVRKVLAEAARRGMMAPVPEGSRREVLILVAVLVETGSVRDPQIAQRFAHQALSRLDAKAGKAR
jgi:TfoX/Sxy family transcriptional regulator of competence genes